MSPPTAPHLYPPSACDETMSLIYPSVLPPSTAGREGERERKRERERGGRGRGRGRGREEGEGEQERERDRRRGRKGERERACVRVSGRERGVGKQ